MDDFRRPRQAPAYRARPLQAVHQARPIKQHQPVVVQQPQFESESESAAEQAATYRVKTINIRFGMPRFLAHKKIQRFSRAFQHYFRTTRRRVALGGMIVVILLSVIAPSVQNLFDHKVYALNPGENAVLLPTNQSMADKLKLDTSQQVYMFNQGYKPADPGSDISAGGSLIKAAIYQDPAKGVDVTDPVNNVDFTIKPLFNLGTGQQQQNRVVFPAFNGGGHLVYTAGAIGVKQDVTLEHYIGDNLKYSYEMDLGNQYAARLEKDGSIGVYGSSLPLNGNISTGNAKDAALLKKAQQKAVKDKLLFQLPPPVIKQTDNHLSDTHAHYVLSGDKLDVVVDHLKDASYPLSIDPTVTAASGSGLFSFDANIETNVYVDPNNNNFERSPLTGGNLLTWNSASVSTAAAHFLGASVVYGGTLYVIGGSAGTTTNISNGGGSHFIEQTKINSDGTLAGFTDGNYGGLPSGGLSRFQVLVYNGYIYIIDGINGFTSTAAGGTVSDAVYYTRVTSESYSAFTNGAQLANWSTTTNKPSTPVYDYGAAVSSSSLYLAGGLNSAGTAQTAVLHANILPNGDLGTFSAATASLPAGRFGMDMQAYNSHLYIVGGNTGTLASASLQSGTLYASIASDGSIADSSWKTGSSLVSIDGKTTQAIENLGEQFTMIYNGYIYASGGCGAVNSNGACTTTLGYSQLAQINADGSLGTFFPNDFQQGGTSTLTRVGTPTLGYNGNMYSIGGCSAMPTTGVNCNTTTLTTTYSAVNSTVGDISAKRNPTELSVANGAQPLFGQSTVVLNGYLYLIGGCTTTSLSGGTYSCNGERAANYITYYDKINADGSLGSTWTNNTVATNATSLHFDGDGGNNNCATDAGGQTDQCGLAGAAATTYNGYIYVVGGNDGAAYNKSVYYMAPNPSTGATATWVQTTTAATEINTAVSELGAFASSGFLYTVGGCYGSTGIACSNYSGQVQKSPLDASTGAPGTFTALSGAGSQLQIGTNGRAAFGLAFYGGYIYLAGGIDSANNQLATVVRAKLNSSGDIVAVSGTTWQATTATMTQPRRRTVAAVINGYLYVIGGHNAADTTGPPGGANGTTYGDVQIGKLDLSTGGTGDIAGDASHLFTKSATSTLTPRWSPAVAVGDGFMYVTGGCLAGPPPGGCTNITPDDTATFANESFVVYNADNLGVNSWVNTAHTYAGDLSQSNRVGMASTVYNGYLYVAGGCSTFTVSSLSCTATDNTSAYAQIKADGTLGSWTAGPTLTTGTAFGQLVALNGYLYYMGGQTGSALTTAVSNTYYSQLNASTGAPAAWTAATGAVGDSGSGAVARTQFSAVVYANRIFVAGGSNDSGTNQSTVLVSPALATGGDISKTWFSTTAGFTTARRELSLVSAGAYLFVIGGYDGTNYYADVQVATPNTSSGDISAWSFDNSMPYKQAGMSAVGANGYIYTFGGRNGVATTSCTNNVNFAAVNGNGTVGDWQQPANTLATASFGSAAGYSNGYFFLSGGDDCTNIITTNVVQQSGQLSEAIHATYSRYVDFGTDATFRQLYVLGTNAQISGVDIDRWKISVKTATGVNASTQGWGQKFGTTLTGLGTGPAYGSPITFQALDASGVDQGAARYWDITFDIDQAQSFNFPDAATPPQITKYDFYFSPGPGKRLRDGKTFVNEQQTTLDAHP